LLLEEAIGLSRNLAHHRRARLEATIGEALDEVDKWTAKYKSCSPTEAKSATFPLPSAGRRYAPASGVPLGSATAVQDGTGAHFAAGKAAAV
jgi:hypothetical protein